MFGRFHSWYHTVSTSDSGLLIVGIVCAFLGAIIFKYYDIWFSRWSSARSEKKRKRTIEQLRAEIELLRPYHKDRDKLFITTASSGFFILGLFAISSIVGTVSNILPLATNAVALVIAFYIGRLVYRVGRFDDFEREIEAQIEKLSRQGSEDVGQPATGHIAVSASAQQTMEVTCATSLDNSQEKWNITGGTWDVKSNGLELTSVNADGSAAYIWRMERLRLPASISFKATFRNVPWPGLRVNLFAASPNETYFNSNHVQLLIPWENGGYKIDYMHGSPKPITQTLTGVEPSPDQTYTYLLEINLEKILVSVNGQIQLAADARNNIIIRQLILEMPNAGGYWGFAGQGGLYEISELNIVSVD